MYPWKSSKLLFDDRDEIGASVVCTSTKESHESIFFEKYIVRRDWLLVESVHFSLVKIH